jgi:hypothetical protein
MDQEHRQHAERPEDGPLPVAVGDGPCGLDAAGLVAGAGRCRGAPDRRRGVRRPLGGVCRAAPRPVAVGEPVHRDRRRVAGDGLPNERVEVRPGDGRHRLGEQREGDAVVLSHQPVEDGFEGPATAGRVPETGVDGRDDARSLVVLRAGPVPAVGPCQVGRLVALGRNPVPEPVPVDAARGVGERRRVVVGAPLFEPLHRRCRLERLSGVAVLVYPDVERGPDGFAGVDDDVRLAVRGGVPARRECVRRDEHADVVVVPSGGRGALRVADGV